MEEEGEEGGHEGVEDVEGWEGRDGGRVEGQGQRVEGEGEEGGVGFGGEDCDCLRIRRVRDDFDRERRGGRVEQGRVHEAVLVAVAVPEQQAGFVLLGAADGFGLQVRARGAVELVGHGDGGGVVESHEAGEFGEVAGDEGFCCRGLFEGRGGDLNGWGAVAGVGAGDGDVGAGGFEGVDWVGGGGVEGDYFAADGQVVAGCLLVGVRDILWVQIDPLTNLALKRTYQRLLLRLSARWHCPIDPKAVQELRALFFVLHDL